MNTIPHNLTLRNIIYKKPATTREKWRLAELSLVGVAHAVGGMVFLVHELSGGGLWWQMLSTPIFVAYLYVCVRGCVVVSV